jgi:flavin reductase (DIM6/NTAB) family NADH-FMN oxidoreductase RutF
MDPEPRIVQEAFREAMAAVCTPVSVVTAVDHDRPHGTTVSAFASLSMSPPMVLVSLDQTSDLLRIVRDAGTFGLNILGAEQVSLARTFATKGSAKFAGIRWREKHGVPCIEGVRGWLACHVERLIDGGDHVIILGTVRAAESESGAPLTYHERTFGTHSSIEHSAALSR